MKIKLYHVIGLMSGTSLDGLDLCYVKFEKHEEWRYEIIFTETLKYSDAWSESLKNAISFSDEKLLNLDKEYSLYLAHAITNFIDRNEISQLDLICSHGHTVFHRPDKGITYQIGNRPEIKTNIKYPVICDFRVQDVALGGQGAPLVPIGDRLLFKNYDYCLNLGGFANVSFEEDENRIAHDICPVNIVMNHYARSIGLEYDDNGNLARNGSINKRLLDELNDLAFYEEHYPKSLGLEWVQNWVFPLTEKYKLQVNDVLRTFVEHVAIQIDINIKTKNCASIFVTGGGAFNGFLMERIKDLSSNQVVVPDNKVINFKEALIFAFLGVLKFRNEVNCLSSVTGASHDHSSGKIYR